ncbi:MAG: hypothetical protein WBQ14_08820 [Gaiellaceae bacterium]
MSIIGAEMGQMQQLKSTFDRESQTVAQLTSTISGQVANTLRAAFPLSSSAQVH